MCTAQHCRTWARNLYKKAHRSVNHPLESKIQNLLKNKWKINTFEMLHSNTRIYFILVRTYYGGPFDGPFRLCGDWKKFHTTKPLLQKLKWKTHLEPKYAEIHAATPVLWFPLPGLHLATSTQQVKAYKHWITWNSFHSNGVITSKKSPMDKQSFKTLQNWIRHDRLLTDSSRMFRMPPKGPTSWQNTAIPPYKKSQDRSYQNALDHS
jgi:hypothetical protein